MYNIYEAGGEHFGCKRANPAVAGGTKLDNLPIVERIRFISNDELQHLQTEQRAVYSDVKDVKMDLRRILYIHITFLEEVLTVPFLRNNRDSSTTGR